jgi:hypothetical protein
MVYGVFEMPDKRAEPGITCSLCGQHVVLETAKVDDYNKAVHED